MNLLIRDISSDFSRYLTLHKKVGLILLLAIFFHNPGMLFSILYRIEYLLITNKRSIFRLIGKILLPLYFIITYYILDIDIDPTVQIGSGLYVHNKGIIISSTVSIGKNCTILGPITIGMDLNGHKAPKIENNVTICTGARVIGNITLGDNVTVGANAVVINSVRSGVVVGGVPATILKGTSKLRA